MFPVYLGVNHIKKILHCLVASLKCLQRSIFGCFLLIIVTLAAFCACFTQEQHNLYGVLTFEICEISYNFGANASH